MKLEAAPIGRVIFAAVFSLASIIFFSECTAALTSDWAYRIPIDVSWSGGDLTDFQVNLSIDTTSLYSAGKLRADCGDIRFTDSGDSGLYYWIEDCNTDGTNGGNSIIWVKVPQIDGTVYMYYGNPSAATTADANETMIRAEDFELGDYGLFSPYYTHENAWSVETEKSRYGDYSMVFDSSICVSLNCNRYSKGFVTEDEVVVEYYIYFDHTAGWFADVIYSEPTSPPSNENEDSIYAKSDTNKLYYYTDDTTYHEICDYSNGQWYKFVHIFRDTANKRIINIYDNDGNQIGTSGEIPLREKEHGLPYRISFGDHDNGGQVTGKWYVDMVFSHRYVTPWVEVSLGTEEIVGNATTTTTSTTTTTTTITTTTTPTTTTTTLPNETNTTTSTTTTTSITTSTTATSTTVPTTTSTTQAPSGAEWTEEDREMMERIYECIIEGNCTLYRMVQNITETTAKIWNEYKETDDSVVTDEDIVKSIVSAISNLTISYIIYVPKKEGYGVIDGIQGYDDFLPIRMSYWFLDETNTTCHSQEASQSSGSQCSPLTVTTVGQIDTPINFTIDIKPSLSPGNYTIVRDIEIDPDSTWIDFGQEIIGGVEILSSEESSVYLRHEEPDIESFEQLQEEPETTDTTLPPDTEPGIPIGTIAIVIIVLTAILIIVLKI